MIKSKSTDPSRTNPLLPIPVSDAPDPKVQVIGNSAQQKIEGQTTHSTPSGFDKRFPSIPNDPRVLGDIIGKHRRAALEDEIRSSEKKMARITRDIEQATPTQWASMETRDQLIDSFRTLKASVDQSTEFYKKAAAVMPMKPEDQLHAAMTAQKPLLGKDGLNEEEQERFIEIATALANTKIITAFPQEAIEYQCGVLWHAKESGRLSDRLFDHLIIIRTDRMPDRYAYLPSIKIDSIGERVRFKSTPLDMAERAHKELLHKELLQESSHYSDSLERFMERLNGIDFELELKKAIKDHDPVEFVENRLKHLQRKDEAQEVVISQKDEDQANNDLPEVCTEELSERVTADSAVAAQDDIPCLKFSPDLYEFDMDREDINSDNDYCTITAGINLTNGYKNKDLDPIGLTLAQVKEDKSNLKEKNGAYYIRSNSMAKKAEPNESIPVDQTRQNGNEKDVLVSNSMAEEAKNEDIPVYCIRQNGDETEYVLVFRTGTKLNKEGATVPTIRYLPSDEKVEIYRKDKAREIQMMEGYSRRQGHILNIEKAVPIDFIRLAQGSLTQHSLLSSDDQCKRDGSDIEKVRESAEKAMSTLHENIRDKTNLHKHTATEMFEDVKRLAKERAQEEAKTCKLQGMDLVDCYFKRLKDYCDNRSKDRCDQLKQENKELSSFFKSAEDRQTIANNKQAIVRGAHEHEFSTNALTKFEQHVRDSLKAVKQSITEEQRKRLLPEKLERFVKEKQHAALKNILIYRDQIVFPKHMATQHAALQAGQVSSNSSEATLSSTASHDKVCDAMKRATALTAVNPATLYQPDQQGKGRPSNEKKKNRVCLLASMKLY